MTNLLSYKGMIIFARKLNARISETNKNEIRKKV